MSNRVFRLKKHYPGLHSNAFEARETDRSFRIADKNNIALLYYYNKSDITDNPEFWEEIPAKTYEILSFYSKNIGGGDDTYVDPTFIWLPDKRSPESSELWSRMGYMTKPFGTEEILSNRHYGIHSIKRLTDGEVFTMGDICNITDSNDCANPIIGFTLLNNSILVQLQLSHTDPFSWFDISICQKSKKPLLITEDGKKIYSENETFYFIIKNNTKIEEWNAQLKKNYKFQYEPDGEKYFSTRKAAEDYVLQNTKLFSIQDLTSAVIFCDIPNKVKFFDKLIEKARQLINN